MLIQSLLICVFFHITAIDPDWDLKKNSSGIEIYTRSVEGSSFDEFKGVTVIPDVSLPEVLDVILDVENYGLLFPDCMNPRILKQDGKWYDIHYMQTKGPLTIKDRDCVYEQTTKIDSDGKHARVTLIPLPDYIAEMEDMVRIRNGSGFWDLKEDGGHRVRVIYQFHGEPGGDIPAWIANSFVVSHPYKTLLNLKSRVSD